VSAIRSSSGRFSMRVNGATKPGCASRAIRSVTDWREPFARNSLRPSSEGPLGGGPSPYVLS
jgi:hypothetical protein